MVVEMVKSGLDCVFSSYAICEVAFGMMGLPNLKYEKASAFYYFRLFLCNGAHKNVRMQKVFFYVGLTGRQKNNNKNK